MHRIVWQHKTFIIAYAIVTIIIILPWRHSCNLNDYILAADLPNDLVRNTNVSLNTEKIHFCPTLPEDEFSFNLPGIYSKVTEHDLQNLPDNLKIQPGGHWCPSECFPQFSTAIIVPYRDRPDQLNAFLLYMHHFLTHQKLNYTVYIIEQSPEKPFNRGKLLNIGFKEATQLSDHTCFIFHDVDLLPEIPLNVYACSLQPRHMVVALNTFRYNLPYCDLFGGAVAFTKQQFVHINGYANRFFGWGGEDDDLAERLLASGHRIGRWDPKVSRYFMLPHKKELPNENRFSLLKESNKYRESDGLISLHYNRLDFAQRDLYTWILAEI